LGPSEAIPTPSAAAAIPANTTETTLPREKVKSPRLPQPCASSSPTSGAVTTTAHGDEDATESDQDQSHDRRCKEPL
jgi:hypothetical protein